MKVKIEELSGVALDWAVAKCEPDDTVRIYFDEDPGEKLCHDDWDVPEFSPSTDWAQGGQIIEREGIDLQCQNTELWAADLGLESSIYGTTLLIAAMRCYVASKLGDEVEVPDELLEGESK
jgi:hypothetical protein